MTHDVNSRLVL